ncbi:hypothetical protein KCH_00060 [Kitasatospora cheerisanensis KCTC 2395]|uniref:Uncharacterized protein n=1 Tax=Kitasatospora cheerisanensis KCTC 2395 TaxID=1348663 RepID=A0A066Z7N0_9ACTN|nr:hypothetical protein KCH_00060 [Kitasatospora cheerisanensis KCTC 2395]
MSPRRATATGGPARLDPADRRQRCVVDRPACRKALAVL